MDAVNALMIQWFNDAAKDKTDKRLQPVLAIHKRLQSRTVAMRLQLGRWVTGINTS